MTAKQFELLNKINTPKDLKTLNKNELPQLCNELRQFIIQEVATNPGHLGASLGTVELTVALHYVMDTPNDKLVWDVGHQAYSHKILTGRRESFSTNRKLGGLCGFPSRDESEYDAFGAGHSSTSISAALGMSVASLLKGDNNHFVAIIGDGALTGGMAYEALNNAMVTPSNLLIILNDNQMSISPNLGGMSNYLMDISTSNTYNKFREEFASGIERLLGKERRDILSKMNTSIKAILSKQSNIFEGFKIRYFGVADGHNVLHLVEVLEDLKKIKGPKVLHCRTKKGKGYAPAETAQTEWHAPGLFNKDTGERIKEECHESKPQKYQDVFGHTLVELAKQNNKIIGVTPAMLTGCSMHYMYKEIPNRTFDVGIAEQHAVTFSAGAATEGFIPFCNIYSSFMQRAFDQVIHDVALQKLPVILCLDRGGIVGEDGPTHHGAFDLAFLRCIPNIIVSAPMNEVELRNLMFTAQTGEYGTFSIRYPRGVGIICDWKQPFELIEIGKGRKIKDGKDIAILSIGTIGNNAMSAIEMLSDENIDVALYDMRFVKPIDEALLNKIFSKFDKIITLEDGTIVGGFGSAVLEYASEKEYKGKIKRIGIPDKFITHGKVSQLQEICKIDSNSIAETIKQLHLS